jgi:DNA/RNA-binding domain of Phe-tRNA-synthetase-like protein
MILISPTEEWKTTHPEAVIGLLELSGVDNNQKCPPLDDRKREIEAQLREKYGEFTRQELVSLPVMSAYKQYYSRFKKTYHVQLQVESIAQKGRKLPNVSPLVDANFIAEMETFILTAGHDVEKLQKPILIDVSREGDTITQMNGQHKPIRAGDMIMRDAGGVSCSIIYGQDNRSYISPETSHVLYVAYVPEDVFPEIVNAQLEKIEEYIRLFSPNAKVEQKRLLRAVL